LIEGGLFFNELSFHEASEVNAYWSGVRVIQNVFRAAGHSRLSVEYIEGFDLMRHRVDHALD
jgi:hypothetical protein